jgi:menaquinone-dependent protoporphyrinogen oxidase
MSILIAYSTKSGGSRECAELLAAKIGNCVVCNLNEQTPSLAECDTVILGSAIHIGHAYKPFAKFVKENESSLLTKKLAFFMCNRVDEIEKIAKANIPEKLRDAAFCIRSFGGKKVLRKEKDQSWIRTDEMDAFVQAVKEMSGM